VVEALRSGSWLILENANLCPSSVLDRLNSLCEKGGKLVLNEKGSIGSHGAEEIIPHPNFRLFMTLDPKHGELSPAMRNRGVELYVHGMPDGSSKSIAPFLRSLTARGVMSRDDTTVSKLAQSLGLDSLLETAYIHRHFLSKYDYGMSDEANACWLLQTSPIALVQPLQRLWNTTRMNGNVLSLVQKLWTRSNSTESPLQSSKPLWSSHAKILGHGTLGPELLYSQVRISLQSGRLLTFPIAP
jgi:midasin (ATPase involved in ribosome maturation)